MSTPHPITYLIDALGLGGAERLLISTLRHLDRAQFAPRVCALQARDGNPVARDIERLDVAVDRVPVRNLRDPLALPRLLRYLGCERPALLHTQLEFANTLGTLAGRLLAIPTITTLHTFDDPPKGARAHRRLRLMWWCLRHFSRRILAVSEATRQHHVRLGRLSPTQITTLYNGIDLSPFHSGGWGIRGLSLGLSPNPLIPAEARILMTVAVLRPEKGIQVMLSALPAILAAVPDVYYVVVGGGDHEAILRAEAARCGVAERVIFTGVRDDVPQLLSEAHVFVLPTFADALPTVLAEAMAAGRPIVASNVGGVPEMVEHGRNGLLVPPADPAALAQACIHLLNHPAQAQAMGRAGRAIVQQRFDARRQVRRLVEIYEELL
ncbi:MAG: glycosyltransferase [Chloroflexota bacterium]